MPMTPIIREKRGNWSIVMGSPQVGGSTVEPVHGPLDTFVQPALHRLGHGIEQRIHGGTDQPGEEVKSEIGKVVHFDRPGVDSDPEPGMILPARDALHAAESVVPARATR